MSDSLATSQLSAFRAPPPSLSPSLPLSLSLSLSLWWRPQINLMCIPEIPTLPSLVSFFLLLLLLFSAGFLSDLKLAQETLLPGQGTSGILLSLLSSTGAISPSQGT